MSTIHFLWPDMPSDHYLDPHDAENQSLLQQQQQDFPLQSRFPSPSRFALESRFTSQTCFRGLIAASYPIRGVYHFLLHQELWPIARSRLVPLSLVSMFVYLILFMFAFLPQVAVLAIFQGRAAWASAVFLVLGEGLIIIQALFEGFFVDECLVDVWDATFIEKGLVEMIGHHRELHPGSVDAVKMLGRPKTTAIFFPFSLKQICELILFLPLNLIPYAGVPLFVMITGSRLGKLSHYRWFHLRGMNKKQRTAELREHWWEYTCFGTVAMALQLVPVLSFFFLITSAAGAALWAARLEDEKLAREGGGPLEAVVSRRTGPVRV